MATKSRKLLKRYAPALIFGALMSLYLFFWTAEVQGPSPIERFGFILFCGLFFAALLAGVIFLWTLDFWKKK
jgi:hypothetical protein